MIIQIKLGRREKRIFHFQLYLKYRNVIILNYDK